MSSSTTEGVIRSGEVVSGRYRVLRTIGRGGMGAVYEVTDERLGVRMALKESCAKEDELKKQFEREARLLASLKHDALPKVVDYFVDDDRAFLVMEFVDGVSLSEVVTSANGPLPVREVIALADQILDVLVYLHGHGQKVVHRDIKPQNLRLRSNGRISLLDFGLAKNGRGSDRAEDERSVHGYSRRFSPIEQIRDSGTTERSDIYALGATLYFLLTGVRPDDAEKRDEVKRTTGADCLRRADEIVPHVGKELALIIERAMGVMSEERFQTAAEFREALRQLGREPVAEERTVIVRPVRPSRVRRLAIAASVIFVLAIGLGLLGRGRSEEATTMTTQQPTRPFSVSVGMDATREVPAAAPKTKVKPTVRPLSIPKTSTPSVAMRSEPRRKTDPVNRERITPQSKPRRSASQQVAAVRVPSRSSGSKAERSSMPEVMRAPDGTEVVRFKDGRLHVNERGGMRQ